MSSYISIIGDILTFMPPKLCKQPHWIAFANTQAYIKDAQSYLIVANDVS